jgi:hypothetical protein
MKTHRGAAKRIKIGGVKHTSRRASATEDAKSNARTPGDEMFVVAAKPAPADEADAIRQGERVGEKPRRSRE